MKMALGIISEVELEDIGMECNLVDEQQMLEI